MPEPGGVQEEPFSLNPLDKRGSDKGHGIGSHTAGWIAEPRDMPQISAGLWQNDTVSRIWKRFAVWFWRPRGPLHAELLGLLQPISEELHLFAFIWRPRVTAAEGTLVFCT